jgi:hypothetical protein
MMEGEFLLRVKSSASLFASFAYFVAQRNLFAEQIFWQLKTVPRRKLSCKQASNEKLNLDELIFVF